ncbi:hypothetical protein [Actinomyces succiniciruminis]|uniref:Uncharacterized protein n=1 Tax=Actinomyces succiniciruminis TaxID=1522002 RepID=A0A1L7RS81_9ACTO|nr:hypothetical protein [Actinomyces succiniciruminis]CED92458.1 Hypothetical protein AAM4_2626 [Actinomyces succiniciruminis]
MTPDESGPDGEDWEWQVDELLVAADAGAQGAVGGAAREEVPPVTGLVDWWSLTPAQRASELAALRLFVGRLVAAYRWDSSTVPACWEQHEAAVRMLDALRQSYRSALSPGMGGSVMVAWHRDLAFIRGELREFFSGRACRTRHDPDSDAAALQSWAQDIEQHGRASRTWTKAQERAYQAYQRQARDWDPGRS